MKLPKPEIHYVFKEYVIDNTIKGENKKRLLTPWSNPMLHEFPMDWYFDSPEHAMQVVKEQGWEAHAKNWILCKEVLTPIPKPKKKK